MLESADTIQWNGKSSASLLTVSGADSYRQPAPTKDEPAIFLLHKMGETEPLVHVSSRQYKVDRNGQPMEIVLDTGKQVPVNRGDIRFERWTNDQSKSEGTSTGAFASLPLVVVLSSGEISLRSRRRWKAIRMLSR